MDDALDEAFRSHAIAIGMDEGNWAEGRMASTQAKVGAGDSAVSCRCFWKLAI